MLLSQPEHLEQCTLLLSAPTHLQRAASSLRATTAAAAVQPHAAAPASEATLWPAALAHPQTGQPLCWKVVASAAARDTACGKMNVASSMPPTTTRYD